MKIPTQVPRYVDYQLPFCVYAIKTPFGSGEINVSRIFLSLYDERLAVALTVWGNIREHFGAEKFNSLFATPQARHDARKGLIETIEFEKRF